MSTEPATPGATRAPRVFVTYAQDSPEHTRLVLRFCTFLRTEAGIDLHLDQWYDGGRRDWSLWAIEQLDKAEFILVIASPAYKRRADGRESFDKGRGSQFEAAIIRNNLTRNLPEETRRVLPVVLPGGSLDEIPTFLCAHSATHYLVDEFTMAAIEPLLIAFSGIPRNAMPPRGPYQPRRSGSVLLTTSLRPVSRGPDLQLGGADLNGNHYGNSIVHRCSMYCSDPRSAIDYNLGRRFHTFHATVGVLDEAREPEQVGIFQVFLDGTPQPQARAVHGAPVTIKHDVSGVLRLRLVAYRPDTVASPLLAGAMLAGGRSARLPDLAWGDPSLSA